MKELKTYCESLFDIEDVSKLHIGEKINDEIEVDAIQNGIIFFKKLDTSRFYTITLDEKDLAVIIQLCRNTNCNTIIFKRGRVNLKVDKLLDLHGIKIITGENIIVEFHNSSGVIKNGILETQNNLEIIFRDNTPGTEDYTKFKFENVQAKGDVLVYYMYPFITLDSKSSITVRRTELKMYIYDIYKPVINELRDVQENDKIKQIFQNNGLDKVNTKKYIIYDFGSNEYKVIIFAKRGKKISRGYYS